MQFPQQEGDHAPFVWNGYMKRALFFLIFAAAIAADADVLARWTFDDYPVGTVLEPGAVFRNKLNPGTYDLVLRAVDPSKAAAAFLPVVTNGFPAYLKWEPYLGASTNCELETCSHAVKFNAGAAKGYYLELADPSGELKTSNWTLEMFARTSGGAYDGTAISMPAMTDGTMTGTNSICYSVPLATWPKTYLLKDLGGGAYNYVNAGWNASARGSMLNDEWYPLAVQCTSGTLYYRRDTAAMYLSTPWIQPDQSAPFLFGGTLWEGDFNGCIAEIRLTSSSLDYKEMARATVEGAPHGTTILYARYEPADGYHFSGALAKYYNQDSSAQTTHNAKNLVFTNDVQSAFVHPGRAMPRDMEKNLSSLVPTNSIHFGENLATPLIDLQNVTLECFVRIDEITGTGDRFSIAQLSFYPANEGNALWGLNVLSSGRLSATWVPYNLAAPGQYWTSEISTSAGDVINDGKWHHVALVVVVDSAAPKTTIKLYLDHELKASSSFNGWLRPYSNGVSRRWFVIKANNGWRGAIDELRISAGALDPETEMLWQFNHGGTLLYFR